MGNGQWAMGTEPELAGFSEDDRGDGVNDHRDLVVWQAGMAFAVQMYRATSAFPRQEQYGLTAQLPRIAL